MKNSFKTELVNHLKQAGAYDVRVADPRRGFEHAEPGRHPLELWPACRSVVVFAVAMSPQCELTYVGPHSPTTDARTMRFNPSFDHAVERLAHLFVATIAFWGASLLQEQGHRVSLSASGLPGLLSEPTTPSKLCAYEAGLGVYGRSGLILHPELGNRLSIGTLLTDALLAPDPRLTDFEPCNGCNRCIRLCPAGAYDEAKSYPHSWSREKCQSKTTQIAATGYKCNNCFIACPAGQLADEALLFVQQKVGLYPPPKSRRSARPGHPPAMATHHDTLDRSNNEHRKLPFQARGI
jgi:epoxyqueuosine reductase QueG